ncbi:PIN domain-containing protein [Natrinema salaciae]|uniref:Ribonuclease VapC n=1 Tax=Natrinema salaciae TaxID=1186196 RepID=A0A1H9J7B7_9EURY|nr:PIN domain-containing protein [Natrinema salaciae]SEQ82686.1 hypothetical protein SAMN04489841_2457 [Natrinema salaciae]
MIAFDSTFLIDYLEGESATAELLKRLDEPVYYAPAIALYEIYEGAAIYDGDDLETARDGLDWIEPLEFDHDAAIEAARLIAELRSAGEPISDGDVLIAGICRRHGASLVTRDSHFETVTGLETISY